MPKITKRRVDALTPIEGRHVLIWDNELPGFGVRCLPSGAKIYMLKYRVRGAAALVHAWPTWAADARNGP